jgi:2-methylisocitrate lyase-like PEP mutase family enzyme
VLPNAWDVASALVFARSPSCRAIGTTSWGIAALLGRPDGEFVTRDEMLQMVGRIASAVDVPVTADVEGGYGTTIQAAAETAEAAIEAGAAGINFEDADRSGSGPLLPVERQVERLRAIRETAERAGVALVLNARTDVYLSGEGEPEELFEEPVRRLNAYRRAGADCLYPIAASGRETIQRLVTATRGPLNIFAQPGVLPPAELEALGVRRLGIGSWGQRVAMGVTARIAAQLLEQGRLDFMDEALPREETAELFAQRP